MTEPLSGFCNSLGTGTRLSQVETWLVTFRLLGNLKKSIWLAILLGLLSIMISNQELILGLAIVSFGGVLGVPLFYSERIEKWIEKKTEKLRAEGVNDTAIAQRVAWPGRWGKSALYSYLSASGLLFFQVWLDVNATVVTPITAYELLAVAGFIVFVVATIQTTRLGSALMDLEFEPPFRMRDVGGIAAFTAVQLIGFLEFVGMLFFAPRSNFADPFFTILFIAFGLSLSFGSILILKWFRLRVTVKTAIASGIFLLPWGILVLSFAIGSLRFVSPP